MVAVELGTGVGRLTVERRSREVEGEWKGREGWWGAMGVEINRSSDREDDMDGGRRERRGLI